MDQPTPPYLLVDQDVPARRRLARLKWFGLFVLLPTLLTAAWLFIFAADQYESRAQFLVRSADLGTPSGGMGALAQMVGLGASGSGDGEVASIAAYLESHDAVNAADEVLDLAAIFRRPEADVLSRLPEEHPSAEDLAEHFRSRVEVAVDPDTGIAGLSVLTYRPEDAQQLAETLLRLGEARVNELNERASVTLLEAAEEQLVLAEGELARIGSAIAAYRRSSRDVDPRASGEAGLELAATLRGELSDLRAREAAMTGVSPDSPQRQALRRRIEGLSREVAEAEARLAGTDRALATRVGEYEDLRMEQEFAAKRYEMAALAAEEARDQALRQNLFVVRVVEPNLPEEALYPKRVTIVATVFLGLCLAYGIGWLLVAGVKEHAA